MSPPTGHGGPPCERSLKRPGSGDPGAACCRGTAAQPSPLRSKPRKVRALPRVRQPAADGALRRLRPGQASKGSSSGRPCARQDEDIPWQANDGGSSILAPSAMEPPTAADSAQKLAESTLFQPYGERRHARSQHDREVLARVRRPALRLEDAIGRGHEVAGRFVPTLAVAVPARVSNAEISKRIDMFINITKTEQSCAMSFNTGPKTTCHEHHGPAAAGAHTRVRAMADNLVASWPAC